MFNMCTTCPQAVNSSIVAPKGAASQKTDKAEELDTEKEKQDNKSGEV